MEPGVHRREHPQTGPPIPRFMAPQWSPAFIAGNTHRAIRGAAPYMLPQWSPAFIAGNTWWDETAGELHEIGPQWSPAFIAGNT